LHLVFWVIDEYGLAKRKRYESRNLSHVYLLHLILYNRVRYNLQNKIRKLILDILHWQSTFHNRLKREKSGKDDEKFTVSKNNILRTETNR
jgi:hypothetical protein